MKRLAIKITLVLSILAIAATLLVPVASAADPIKKGQGKNHRLDSGFDGIIGALQPLLSLAP